jgi:hypothetical protein
MSIILESEMPLYRNKTFLTRCSRAAFGILSARVVTTLSERRPCTQGLCGFCSAAIVTALRRVSRGEAAGP